MASAAKLLIPIPIPQNLYGAFTNKIRPRAPDNKKIKKIKNK